MWRISDMWRILDFLLYKFHKKKKKQKSGYEPVLEMKALIVKYFSTKNAFL